MSKQQHILQAALKLIVRDGLHSVTMAQIADEAKVGIGTIYRNFKDKENIVQQVWIAQKAEESNFVFEHYTPQGTIKQRFWFLWKQVIQYFVQHKTEYYFSYHFAASPILTEEIHQIAMNDFLAFDAMFQEGIDQNLFKENLTARQLRLYSFSSINGWLLWAFDLNLELNDAQMELYIQMLWDAIEI